MVNAYPLEWPPGKKRSQHRERSKFNEKRKNQHGWTQTYEVSHTRALSVLQTELDRLGANNVVLSTNLELRLDGLPKANRRILDDPGAAVYFRLDGEDISMACDKYDRVEDNMYAIGKTIEAMRAIERWGSKEMMHAAFKGFKALPAPDQVMITSVQYFADCVSEENVRRRHKELAKELHPDVGGDINEFNEMQRQYEVSLSQYA